MDAQQLISYLNRGGYGYYWIKYLDNRVETVWIGAPPPGKYNLFFAVNPCLTRKWGNRRATIRDIGALNCLYAEFDVHNGDKGALFERVKSITPPPSVIVDSGGGFHAYWLLTHTYELGDQTTRRHVREIQSAWVHHVGGDPAASDLNRVLRVPGSLNYKYDPPRRVEIVMESDRRYSIGDFTFCIPPEPERAPTANTNGFSDAVQHWLAQAVSRAHEGNRNDTGFWLACQLRDGGVDQATAESALAEYAHRVKDGESGYYLSEALASCKSAYSQPRREVARSAAAAPAPVTRQAAAPAAPKPASPQEEDQPDPAADDDLPELRYLELDQIKTCMDNQEAGDADLLALLYRGRIVYDHAESAWYTWHEHYWQRDLRGLVYRLVARRVAPQYLNAAATAASRGNDELSKNLARRAAALRNKKRMDNVLFLAARHEHLAVTGDEWDADPWLLGCANGVIDLRSGRLRPGQPGDYIRAHSEVPFQGISAPAPRWERFIAEIMGDDDDLRQFAQRLLGYGITGLTVEHCFAILWGEGRNGKSTLLETLADVLGPDLATSSQADAIMDATRGGDGPKPFVFALRGKRLVWTSESNEGRRINAGLVKQLTGGDRLNVRTLHSKPVEFKPTHLLFLLTNHKPHIPADDAAIWERVHLVPFNLRFVDHPAGASERQRDAHLPQLLKSEQPGILAWLVRGCLAWQQLGLGQPEAVKQATAAYREEEDTTGQFILERCIVRAGVHARAAELYAAYQDWCKTNSINAMTGTSFGKQIKRRFNSRLSAGVIYDGIGIAA